MTSFHRYKVLGMLTKTAGDGRFLAETVDDGQVSHHVVREIEDGAFDDARRAAWLRHPNLVTVREIGEAGGQWYAATEYVHGEDLRRVIARVRRAHDQVPIALITAIGAAAAAGLHHAHTHSGSRRTWRGSVHGRVSPSNILIGYDGSVKVAELGLGPPIDASYLAPEQVSGGEIDRRTDVFALGVVLYELATARRLFRAPSDVLTKAAIQHPNIPPPSRFRRGLPRALENIILKALAPSPADRFRSAGELRAALAAFAQRLGMQPSRASIADYLKTLFGERPLPWLPAPRAARAALDDEPDSEQLGVAAPPDWVLRELGVPEASSLEATPPRGTKTPMSWTSQPADVDAAPRPWTWRRAGLMAGGAMVAAVLGYVSVTVIGGSGDPDALVPMIAPPPPPPPPPLPAPLRAPPDASPADASATDASATEESATAPAARLPPEQRRLW